MLVMECSSFQLSKIKNLRFNIAILLNISSDHIDWHGNIQNYIKAKKNLSKPNYFLIMLLFVLMIQSVIK